ncbi:MAG: T9SS C-terminal target domain-containing protein [Ignavibacteriae bacterium]|nr:MAG: T9SS C-terminal target domain-containing protein [Ignavibacteriota bacterium]
MKKILLLIIFFNSMLFADYSTPGNFKSWSLDSLVLYSGGNVTFSGGSYLFNGTISISQSDTLKIRTNAAVKLAASIAFNIYGTIIINPPDSVKFTSIDTTNKFTEMRLDALSDASIIKKLIFEYSFNGMRLFDTNPLIDSCTIRYNCNGNSSITVPAVNLFQSNPIISNCKIYRNYKVAIGGGSNIANAPQIINNFIYENNIANGNVPQINLGQSGTGTTLIKGNTIRGLYTNAGGIATLAAGTLNIIIEDNIIKKNRYGITIQNVNTTAIIRRNIIDSNNIQGIPALGGSGINFYGNSTLTAIVTRNYIRWNLWGVTIQVSAKPNLGNLNNADTSDNGYNYIYGNYHNDTIPDLFNNTPDSIWAENNFWGTGNPSLIEQHIFHKPDNPALGFVDYIPIYLPVSTGNNNIKITGYSLSDAYPNPFNPSTVIRFTIPSKQYVKLEVFNILGELVSVILDKEVNGGENSVTFNAGNLPSGIYFYKLTAGEYEEAKRMILLK